VVGGRDCGVAEGAADVEWAGRVEAESFVDSMMEVFHLFEVVKGGDSVGFVGAEDGLDLGAQLADDRGVAGEFVEEP
jgi:hypothetical protein